MHRLAGDLGLFGPIDAHRVHRIVNAYTLAFFDRHLKGMPRTLLDGLAAGRVQAELQKRCVEVLQMQLIQWQELTAPLRTGAKKGCHCGVSAFA
jgi:hypothetical protein